VTDVDGLTVFGRFGGVRLTVEVDIAAVPAPWSALVPIRGFDRFWLIIREP
jgi:hypothetical protein